jgi:hypothetical protein
VIGIESKKVSIRPKKADETKREKSIAASKPTNQSRVVSRFFDTKRHMAWVPKGSQNIKRKDDVETSSNRITQHSSNANKTMGRNKRMIWVPKANQDLKSNNDSPIYQTGTLGFFESDQRFCSRQFIQQEIQDTAAAELKELGLSSKGVSSGAFLLGWVTNPGTVGGSTDDVSALSVMGQGGADLGLRR